MKHLSNFNLLLSQLNSQSFLTEEEDQELSIH